MGNVASGWANKSAMNCVEFLHALFGPPSEYSKAPGGFATWTLHDLTKKTLFGSIACFEEVTVRDEAIADDTNVSSFMYITVTIPITNQATLNAISGISGCGYDITKQQLWARSCCMDMTIAFLKVLTDFAVGKITSDAIPTNKKAAIQSIQSATDSSAKVDLVKPMYVAICQNLTTATSPPPATPAPATTERMRFGAPWYGSFLPYYESTNPGNIALGEEWEEKYYDSVPLYNDIERMSGVPNKPMPPSCKGSCLGTFNNITKNTNTYDIFQSGSASQPLITLPQRPATPMLVARPAVKPPTKTVMVQSPKTGKKEYFSFNFSMPLSLQNALKMFKLREGLNPNKLFSVASHTSRLEALTVGQAYKLFVPKNTVTVATGNAERMMNKPITVGQAYMLFAPKKEGFSLLPVKKVAAPSVDNYNFKQLFRSGGSRSERMNNGIGIGPQISAAQTFLREVGNKRREGLADRDPRFLPYNALVHYQIGSDTVDIDRVYGTVAQKTVYPKYTDMVKYGNMAVPTKPLS